MEKREGFFGRFFGISQSGSNMRTEILAGITTLITVAYILILNPQVLSDPFVITGDMVMAAKVSNGVFIGTCIGAFIGTFLCALYCDHSGRIASGYHPGNTGSNQNSDHTGNRAFITIIGLKNAGIVVSNPATLVSMVDFAQWRSGENTELICGGNIWKIKHLL